MSIELLSSLLPSAAGIPLAQTAGSDVARIKTQQADHQRDMRLHELADQAAGVAEPDGNDLPTEDRDADGRQPWQRSQAGGAADMTHAAGQPRSGDQCGLAIDLVG